MQSYWLLKQLVCNRLSSHRFQSLNTYHLKFAIYKPWAYSACSNSYEKCSISVVNIGYEMLLLPPGRFFDSDLSQHDF
jgi:hypothetical protein